MASLREVLERKNARRLRGIGRGWRRLRLWRRRAGESEEDALSRNEEQRPERVAGQEAELRGAEGRPAEGRKGEGRAGEEREEAGGRGRPLSLIVSGPPRTEAALDSAERAQRRGDFVLMTYEALRAEVLYHLEQLPKIEQLAMIVTASVFSWMAINHDDISLFGATVFIWLVPLFVTLFCFYRHQVAQMQIRSLTDFIATKLAPEMDATAVSWEEQMRQARLRSRGSHIFRISNRIFWGSLIAVDLVVPLLFAPFWAGWAE